MLAAMQPARRTPRVRPFVALLSLFHCLLAWPLLLAEAMETGQKSATRQEGAASVSPSANTSWKALQPVPLFPVQNATATTGKTANKQQPSIVATWPKGLQQLQPKNNAVDLTLLDVLGQTLSYHPALEAALAKQAQADAKLLQTRGAFDVKLSSAPSFYRYQTSSKPGVALETFEFLNKLSWQTRSGVQLGLASKLIRGDISSSFSPTGEAGQYFLEMRLPLLQGLGRNPAQTAEQQAELRITEAEALLLQKRLELLRKAGASYWYWFTAGHKVRVTESLIELAKLRLKAIQRQAELGDKALIDAVEIEQILRRRETQLAKDQSDFLKAAQELRLYLWEQRDRQPAATAPLLTNVPNRLGDSPPFDPELLPTGKIVAYQSRPELKVLRIGQELAEVDWLLARNQLLPQLDAILAPGYDAGSGGIGTVLRAGAEFQVPLQRRKAKGEQQFAQLRLNELAAQERQTLGQIQIDVHQAVIAIEQSLTQLEKARQQVALAFQMQDAEQRRFDLGDSTIFLVNTREQQTADAQVSLLLAHQDLMLAWLNFWIATAQL